MHACANGFHDVIDPRPHALQRVSGRALARIGSYT
jgi:hypothetical protein